jgi:hypothetical protein
MTHPSAKKSQQRPGDVERRVPIWAPEPAARRVFHVWFSASPEALARHQPMMDL